MGYVITGVESWIRHIDPATKKGEHALALQSPVSKKVHQAKSMNMVMLILFFDV